MRVLFVVLIILVSPVFLFSDTIQVPGDYGTIQEGIDATVNGDVVLVAPGTYEERIDFKGKAITVKSEDGPEGTVIDAKHKGSVVSFQSNEGLDSILDGFTIKNGNNYEHGGGIYCTGASPKIINNLIEKSQSGKKGGGIYCEDSDLIVENNIISKNAAYSFDGVGGGIYSFNSSPVIVNNFFVDNFASEYGGGIYCGKNDTVVIRDNTIFSNDANLAGGGIFCSYGAPVIENNYIALNFVTMGDGGGIFLRRSAAGTVQNCHFHSNYANHNGGGITCSGAHSVSVVNCTFSWNTAVEERGLSLYLREDCSLTVVNSILWNNSNPSPEKEIWIGETGKPSTLTIEYSDVHEGKSAVHVDPGCTLLWGDGMIDEDPLFVKSHLHPPDFHITYPSPCRDAGNNSAITWAEDLEGDPRIAWGGTVDMGSDEFYTHLYVTGDTSPGGSIEGKFIGLPGAMPVGLFIGSDILSSPLPTMWGEFWLQSPWIFFGPLGAIPGDGVMVLPTTLPTGMTVPVDIPMQALIGLNPDSLSNLCVLEVR